MFVQQFPSGKLIGDNDVDVARHTLFLVLLVNANVGFTERRRKPQRMRNKASSADVLLLKNMPDVCT